MVGANYYASVNPTTEILKKYWDAIPAPTASELGEVFPDQFDPLNIHHYKDNSKYTSECFGKGVAGKWFEHENEAECRAQLLIFLIENKHLEL